MHEENTDDGELEERSFKSIKTKLKPSACVININQQYFKEIHNIMMMMNDLSIIMSP